MGRTHLYHDQKLLEKAGVTKANQGRAIMRRTLFSGKQVWRKWTALSIFGLMFLPLQGWAQTLCAVGGLADADCDGFHDALETGGITLFDGTSLVTSRTSKDLFIILVAASPSNLPADPLAILQQPVGDGGLGHVIHELTPSQVGPDRQVSPASPQKAIQITESLNATGEILGVSNLGGPNGIDFATVFTQRILNFVTGVYAGKGQVPPAGLIADYIRHTIAHEAGHVLGLTKDYNSRFGGNHYKAGAHVVMEQSVVYTSKGSTVTFYISDKFAANDPQDACLSRMDQIGTCLTSQ